MSDHQMMKAAGLYRYLPIENPDSLLDLQLQKPSPIGKDLLVKVQAISVNPVDYKVRSPKSKIKVIPRILGWDVSDIIEETGPECTLFSPGDEVYYAGSLERQGGNSEYQVVDERIVGKKPISLDFAQAAALPLTTITAYEGLFDRLLISHDPNQNFNKKILVIGAAGGVGSIAIQLAKLVGLTVIATASRLESIQWVEDLGADFTINHFEEFVLQLHELGIDSVDYIFCLNTTERYWVNMAEVIAPQGKICSIVETEELLDIQLLKNKSVTFVWETIFTRPIFQTSDMIGQHNLLNDVADWIDGGKIKTTLAERISPINAENLKRAHAKLESGTSIGKIVIEGF